MHYVACILLAGGHDIIMNSRHKALTILAGIPGYIMYRYISHRYKR